MSGYDAAVDILPHCGMLDLRGDSAVREAFEISLGMQLPVTANSMVAGPDNLIAFGIAPDHWILHLDESQLNDIVQSLEHAAAGMSHSVVDVSSMYVRIRLSGPEAREVLAQGVSIDLHPRAFPPGTAARTGFAKTTAQIHCVDASPTFIITVFRSYRQYAVDWLRVAIGDAVRETL